MQQLNLNSLFAIEPSIRGMAYQVTSPPGGGEWSRSVGDYVNNSFTALGE